MKPNTSAKLMDCAESRRWVESRIDGEEIPPEVKSRLDRHLASCESCREWASLMEIAIVKLKMIKEPQPSMKFKVRLMRELGLNPVPIWLRWVGGITTSLTLVWLAVISFFSDALLNSAREGLPMLPRILRMGEPLFFSRPGLTQYLPGALEMVLIVFGAAVVLITLGIMASRRINRTSPSTVRSA